MLVVSLGEIKNVSVVVIIIIIIHKVHLNVFTFLAMLKLFVSFILYKLNQTVLSSVTFVNSRYHKLILHQIIGYGGI